jgi:hypothetical protein
VAGIGAVAKGCFANLKDDPLFLSTSGVTAITSTLLSYDRTVENRSFLVDKKLTLEDNLKEAVSCVYDGYYHVFINDRVYILDSRHKTNVQQGGTNYIYEAYYWENVPARVVRPIGNELWFGSALGNLCKFNSDLPIEQVYNDDGEAITAQWATPNDNDGATQLFKTLMKKGCLVTISPFFQSSGKVYFIRDGNGEIFVKSQNMDIFYWDKVNFERFTFSSNESPQEIYFNKKAKKYKRMQIVIRNDVVNEPFGIHEIVKTYSVGNYSK